MGVQKVMTPMTKWTPPQEDPCPPCTHLKGNDHQVALTTLTYSGTDRTHQRDSMLGCIT
jgi:hypothetical protein